MHRCRRHTAAPLAADDSRRFRRRRRRRRTHYIRTATARCYIDPADRVMVTCFTTPAASLSFYTYIYTRALYVHVCACIYIFYNI